VFIGMGLIFSAFAQTDSKPIKRGTLGINFGLYDFQTAQAIRNTSLSNVLGDKNWAKLSEMDIAFGLSYLKGITPFLDYSINGYFGSTVYPSRSNTGTTSGQENFLFEADASLHLKLLPDNY
jgi:OmpA-OmpF porin, OOP family